MARFLAEEAEAQTGILRGLRGRLERGMAAADPASTEPPSREWVRAAALYFDGYRHLAQLQIELAKLELEARRLNGKAPMSDEEYQAKLRDLGRDALDTQPVEELEAAIARRRTLASGVG